MSDLDRKRAERLMREADLDALVLFQPEAFQYAIGAPAGVATMWGGAGAAIALVPENAQRPLAAIVSDHAAPMVRHRAPEIEIRTHRIWIDVVDMSGVKAICDIDEAYRRAGIAGKRPETFDRATCFNLLSDLLRDHGLTNAKIGIDLEFMPAADFEALKRSIPAVHWVDGSLVLRRLRVVKTTREIERLTRAAIAAEAGLKRMMEAVSLNASVPTLSAAWKAGAQEAAKAGGFSLSGLWDYISVGADLSDGAAKVTPGALIKADVGTLVDGYSSDGARTMTYGPAPSMAQDIFRALETAFHAGLEQIRPGNTFGAVHDAMLQSMRRDGFGEYYRGHFGHSVGGGVGIEEWPFFSAGSLEIIEADMVVALEAPFYGQNFGALMIEDQFLVTPNGTQCMNSLPRHLLDLAKV